MGKLFPSRAFQATIPPMKFYISASIPYVNAKPHLGHAYEFVQGDVIARYHRILGDETLYLSGADENALKIVQAAEKADTEVQKFCDLNAEYFKKLLSDLDVQLDIYERSSSKSHHQSSQELWKLCDAAGDIYKKKYEGLYCVGCETFYPKDELDENGECFEHPGKKLDSVTEENYFFRLSKYKDKLIKLIETDTLKIVPDQRKSEVLGFLHGEVNDISISRTRERARGWGVEVSNDPSQMIYVWFDALNVYQSGVGFSFDDATYQKWLPADVHLIGKGIIRFHTVYWIAMLLSAKLQLPKNVYVHGYITVGGQKMSKTLGNVIDPFEMVKKFGSETLRYYFLREMSTTEDIDFTIDRLKETYQAHLANELGNLASRTAKLCEALQIQKVPISTTFTPAVAKAIESYNLKDAADAMWLQVTELNKTLTDKKPWELAEAEKTAVMQSIVEGLVQLSFDLQPFMPKTAKTLLEYFSCDKIGPIQPLFPKLNV